MFSRDDPAIPNKVRVRATDESAGKLKSAATSEARLEHGLSLAENNGVTRTLSQEGHGAHVHEIKQKLQTFLHKYNKRSK